MQFDELRFVCQQAAHDLAATRGRPLPPTVVLPGSPRTRLVALPGLPDDDAGRALLIERLATDLVGAERIPCWGFVAEADLEGHDVVVVAYGARRHVPHIAAAPLGADGVGDFGRAEELDARALPFLHPLQHAVDALPGGGDVFAAFDPKRVADEPDPTPPGPGAPAL